MPKMTEVQLIEAEKRNMLKRLRAHGLPLKKKRSARPSTESVKGLVEAGFSLADARLLVEGHQREIESARTWGDVVRVPVTTPKAVFSPRLDAALSTLQEDGLSQESMDAHLGTLTTATESVDQVLARIRNRGDHGPADALKLAQSRLGRQRQVEHGSVETHALVEAKLRGVRAPLAAHRLIEAIRARGVQSAPGEDLHTRLRKAVTR